jgi:hypothetical protein
MTRAVPLACLPVMCLKNITLGRFAQRSVVDKVSFKELPKIIGALFQPDFE